MGGSDERDTARRERRRVIERLNAMEAELPKPQSDRVQLSEREIEAVIEKERQHNLSRRGFSQTV